MTRSHVTSHVLDSTSGRPARGVAVTLSSYRPEGSVAETGTWMPVAGAVTDDDGRVTALGPGALPAGRYRVTFGTGAYFAALGQPTFYPEVSVVFELAEEAEHYHIPLLLSPFAYSTYRGS